MKGRDYSEDLGTDGKIILKWILEKLDGNSSKLVDILHYHI